MRRSLDSNVRISKRPAPAKPVVRQSVPFHVPSIGEEEIGEVVDTLRSGWITTGPKTARFEQAMCEYVGAQHAVALSSCTAGLHLSLLAAGVGPGHEVISTPYTFAATATAIMHAGAKPVLVDIEANGFNIDVTSIERAITPKTKAIIPVHFAGQPCEMDAINEIADRHKLVVIEDAAHAVGAEYRGRKVGALSRLTAFSFYATKNLTTAEGGMITTDDKALADDIRSLSLHGLSRDAWKRYSKAGSWYYEVQRLGYKCNLSDLQSSVGIHQLAKLEGFQAARTRIADMYDSAFADLPEIETPPHGEGRHAWHLYVIRLNLDQLSIDRAEIIRRLGELGVGASVHFIPLHLHPFFKDSMGWNPSDFPQAKNTYRRAISLPLYPQLESMDGALPYVINCVRDIIIKGRR